MAKSSGRGQRSGAVTRREPSDDPRVNMWTRPNSSTGQFTQQSAKRGGAYGRNIPGTRGYRRRQVKRWLRRLFLGNQSGPFAGVRREN